MKRRDFLQYSVLGTTALASGALAQTAPAASPSCETDGTPAQFIPKASRDTNPLEKELEKYPRCPYCNMDRKEYHLSRMLVHYSDDLVDAVCSIHCLSLSLALNIDREPKALWGADYGAAEEPRPLVEVDKLHFLLGANLPHAMTQTSKHAFALPKRLEEVQKKHGGKRVGFEEALLASYVEMSRDVANIRKRRKERREQAAAPLAYKPGPKSLCPVCGMLVSKYPSWVAVVAPAQGPAFYFDGAKDMFKFLQNPSKYVKAPEARETAKAVLLVTDYYGLRPIDARQAWYVIGSTVLGPMGHEFIPLATEAEARAFMKDHQGRRMLRFEEVSAELLGKVDKGVFH